MKFAGWASQPYYCGAQKKLHRAKELQSNGTSPHTLNGDVRALGRKGVLKINRIADMGGSAAHPVCHPGHDADGAIRARQPLCRLCAQSRQILKKGLIVEAHGRGGVFRLAGGWFKKVVTSFVPLLIATQKSLTSAGRVAHKVIARLAGPGEARSFSGCCCDGTPPETKTNGRQTR